MFSHIDFLSQHELQLLRMKRRWNESVVGFQKFTGNLPPLCSPNKMSFNLRNKWNLNCSSVLFAEFCDYSDNSTTPETSRVCTGPPGPPGSIWTHFQIFHLVLRQTPLGKTEDVNTFGLTHVSLPRWGNSKHTFHVSEPVLTNSSLK